MDVGGNMGTVTMALAKEFPKLKYVVQDLPPVIEGAKGVSFRLVWLRS